MNYENEMMNLILEHKKLKENEEELRDFLNDLKNNAEETSLEYVITRLDIILNNR